MVTPGKQFIPSLQTSKVQLREVQQHTDITQLLGGGAQVGRKSCLYLGRKVSDIKRTPAGGWEPVLQALLRGYRTT